MEKGIEKRKQRKGITLIALVLTIIVLLILAGITINLTIGQDGIITRAQEAGVEHEKAQLKEELELAIFDIRTEKLSKGQSMTREDLIGLEKIGAIIESTGTPAEGEYKDYFFEIDEKYVVTIIGKLKGEKPTVQAQVVTTGIVAQGGKVEIKVTASISEGNITEILATNGAVLKTNTSATEKVFEVSANGTYTFKVKADNGRSASSSVEVNNILEAPQISIKDETEQGFTIVVNNNYAEGLITEYKYYVGGELKSPENTTTKEFTVTGLVEGTIYTNIYVEAYIGEINIASDTATVTTKSIWDEIAKVAEAISDNDDTITRDTAEVNIEVEGKEYKLAVGDTMTLNYDGIAKTVRIIGFNHDTLTDTSAYGEEKTNTYAGISFEFVNFVTNAKMNSTSTNENGWKGSSLYATLNSESELNKLGNKNQIKAVNKESYKMENDVATTEISANKLWLLSCSQIWNNALNSNYAYGWAIVKEGEQYKYYKEMNANCREENENLIKDSNYWWLRSPYCDDDYRFCAVAQDGIVTILDAIYSKGIAPGFAI